MKYMESIKIGQVFKQLIDQSPHKHKLVEAALICAWKQVMPPFITQRTEQIIVKHSKLFLKINSAPLRQEIQNTKGRVLALLKEVAPECELTDIVWL
jgi:hypothetical protein